MRKGILILLALSLLAGATVPAMAAVDNIKVGGDLSIFAGYRKAFSFIDDTKANDFFQTSARVWFAADLSNNVSVMLRLVNERSWGAKAITIPGPDFGVTVDSRKVDVDLAYVKMADFLAKGLTLTVGRQPIMIGEGFVVGSRYNVANYAFDDIALVSPVPLPVSVVAPSLLNAPDLGVNTAFDAIKVTYKADAMPVSAMAFVSKIKESLVASTLIPLTRDEDMNLYGVSVCINPETWSLEPYFVDRVNYPVYNNDNLMTWGIRGTWAPIKGLSFKGEYAKQSGENHVAGTSVDYQGWAGYLGAGYEFSAAMKPMISASYITYSGDDGSDATKTDAWQAIFPSNIADRFGLIGYPALWQFNGLGTGANIWKFGFGIQPTEKLGVALNWFNMSLNDDTLLGEEALGNEVDLCLKYAYTDDVTIGLDAGYFMTGDAIETVIPDATNAWETVLSLKVAF